MRVFLVYPDTGNYLRGEDRCQANVSGSSATSIREPLDMMQVAGVLKKEKIECKFVDYNLSENSLEKDINSFNPNIALLSSTNSTLFEDLKFAQKIKKINPSIKLIIKGAVFFNMPLRFINKNYNNFKYIDIIVRTEIDIKIKELIENIKSPKKVNSIFYNNESDFLETEMIYNQFKSLKELPSPDRSIFNNDLYVRPDTNEKIATIEISRGCLYSCSYCLTPIISGKKIRYRSSNQILTEIKDCYYNYNIKNFFFRADTFTINKKLVHSLCKSLLDEGLNINWVANSRSDTLDEETIKIMKKSGCYLIAFGFEGPKKTKIRTLKKSNEKEDFKVLELCKKYNIKSYGFFIIGFYWQGISEIKETIRYMNKLNCDFVELHLATPYYGTKLFNEMSSENLINLDEVYSHDYFSNPVLGTKYISKEKLKLIRKKALKRYYLRPSYIIKKLSELSSLTELFNYIKYGFKILKD